MIALLYVFLIWCCTLDSINVLNTNSYPTTDTYLKRNSFEGLCNITSLKDYDTFDQQPLFSSYIGNNSNDNNEYMTVNLSGCSIKSVESYICSLCSISRNMSIDLSWNIIRSIDGIDCSCHHIKFLYLSNNKLTLLKMDSFLFAKSVTKIDISRNSVNNLDEHVFNGLKMLQTLDLSINAIRYLYVNVFDDLINLRQLNLSGNKLRYIDSDIFVYLNNLEYLDISCNKIHLIDNEAFRGLENLKYLNLSNNRLSDPKLSSLSIFFNLFSADISSNDFEGFVEGSLDIFHIREIILRNMTYLKYILKGSFRNGDCLNKVDISWNRNLIFIEDSAFQNLPDNITFDISHTGLKSFPCISKNMIITEKETTLNCTFISENEEHLQNHSCACQSEQTFRPTIVSHIEDLYVSYIGQSLSLDCFAVGKPTPKVRWERILPSLNESMYIEEVISESYFLDLEILSLNMEGKYRCTAESNGTKVYKYFKVKLKPIDVKIKMVSRSSTSILVTWSKSKQKQNHVLIYRSYETSSDYVIQRLNSFGKIFVVRSLQPFTDYEICIASFSDINDKSCVRVMTLFQENKTEGIRYNNLAIAFLIISGIIFGVFLLTILYRCIDKVRFITRNSAFIVGSESRECFADVTESTFTYENQHVEHLIN